MLTHTTPHPLSLLSVLPLTLTDIQALFKRCESPISAPMASKIVLTAFFEASTRTRLSFESAAARNGMHVLSMIDPAMTGMAKGESIEDMGHMFNGYADMIVIRHGDLDQFNRLQSTLSIPIINAGNGHAEHPTQALADWYTLSKHNPQLIFGQLPPSEKVHLAIIGHPKKMRSVNSFLLLARLLIHNIEQISIIADQDEDLFSPELMQVLPEFKGKIKHVQTFDKTVKEADVIYINSIAFLANQYERLGQSYKITSSNQLKPSALILHPLARQDELGTELDHTPHNLYFQQASNAVHIRQTLLQIMAENLDRS